MAKKTDSAYIADQAQIYALEEFAPKFMLFSHDYKHMTWSDKN